MWRLPAFGAESVPSAHTPGNLRRSCSRKSKGGVDKASEIHLVMPMENETSRTSCRKDIVMRLVQIFLGGRHDAAGKQHRC